MIWNETMECMNPDQRHEIQSQRLRATVDKVYTKVPFYRAKMQEAGVAPSDIKEIEDIVKLPFTTKQDLRDAYSFNLCSAPQSEFAT